MSLTQSFEPTELTSIVTCAREIVLSEIANSPCAPSVRVLPNRNRFPGRNHNLLPVLFVKAVVFAVVEITNLERHHHPSLESTS